MRREPVCGDVWIVSPFERPDVALACAAAKAGAFPVLHLGRDLEAAQEAVDELAGRLDAFGVCVADGVDCQAHLPSEVSTIILPWGAPHPDSTTADIVWQVRTREEAMDALAAKPETLILKGCESGGIVGDDSAFILFQELLPLCRDAGVHVYVQGGVGVHTGSAYMALGASGVVLDSQVALFPECSLAQETKNALKRITGPEIRTCGHFNYFILPAPDKCEDPKTVDALYGGLAVPMSPILPLGQDVVLSADLVDEHKRIKNLVRVLERGVVTHVNQARISDSFSPDGAAAEALGTTYPIVQGPMSRVSDVPEFLDDIAQGGALPFLAMGMEEGEVARDMLANAANRLEGKPWGAGILGFAIPEILSEQTRYIVQNKPSYVLIAGGRPGQEKVFEQAGIKVLMHAPAVSVLDLFIKEGVTSFIFEGRESGGHVGALLSCVLWEKQIDKILGTQDLSKFLVLFAGGIHDAFSAAFVRIMAAPLTARGVKVGFQCGTVYLYTEEAVTSGAITQAYQNLLLLSDKTSLLKTAFGQETRCVVTPFTEMFEQEKTRMEEEGLPSAQIQEKLEFLNLGRLRVAAKGIGFADGKPVPLSDVEQREQGLYMTGAVTELEQSTTSIAQVHSRLISDSWQVVSDIELPDPRPEHIDQSDIAIIGMAGIFPGAENVDEFWRNIVFGNDCITEVDPFRWDPEIFFDAHSRDTQHTVSKWGGFIGKSDFDALEFGIPPEAVTRTEPIQLLALLVAKRALEDAGLTDPANSDFEETSVFFGVEGAGELVKARSVHTVLREILKVLPPDLDAIMPRLSEYEFPSFLTNITSGRISNRLNTGGRNYTIDAACAASLAALDIAVTELRTKKADMAIVGGADLHNRIDDYLGFNSLGALSPEGRCATFDADADGMAISEGICAIVIKRLEDAERDGNTIYAVIKGIGGSSDGKSLGLTAPSKRGQLLALERAYEDAGLRPSDVGFIEAHGTGTALGDWTEVSALTQFFVEDGAQPGQTALGSLKSVIGHTKTAAGLAGLMKVALCVHYGILPPTLHIRQLNKAFAPGTPFNLRADKAGYWPDAKRIAGVSAFGFGGTNFHAIVQNYEAKTPEAPLASWPSELFVFPGSTPSDAEILMDKVAEVLTLNNKLRLIDIAYSLSLRSIAQTVQYAIVAGTREELLARMKAAREGKQDENTYRLTPVPGKVAFLFPGQGSQRINMAADLFTVFPCMRRLLDGHPEYERVLFPPSAFTESDRKHQRREITDTRYAQPIMGIVDAAMADLLRDFGIVPDVVAGHSYGELPALCCAGVIREEDLAQVSRERADAIEASIQEDKGRMVAVLTNKETLSQLLEGMDGVWPVNYNAPRQIVVSGSESSMEEFLGRAKKAGVACKELNTDCAFHSPLLEGADAKFADAMKEFSFHEPTVPVLSNIDAGLYPPDEKGIKNHLAQHLVSPVLFSDEISAMADDGVSVFIEAGPGGSLTSLVSQSVDDAVCIRIEDGAVNGLTYFLQGMAKYISTGRTIKMSELFKGRGAEALYLEDPQSLKKNGLIFNINGQYAVPDGCEPPNIREQLSQWFAHALSQGGSVQYTADPDTEQVMTSYMSNMAGLITNMGGMIDSMNDLIHDQRDAVLGYLGVSDQAPRRAIPPHPTAELTTGPEPAEPEETPPADEEHLSLASMSADQITDLIFDVVSEKTGYPKSMLSLDTDLEADLSIDSIKKMEIVSELSHRLGMPTDSEGMESSFEQIISIKTFRDLATWLEVVVNQENDNPSGGPAPTASSQPALPAEITRVLFTEKPCPVGATNPDSVEGKSFVITEDGGGLALQVAKKLQSMGANADIVDEEADLTSFDGLILINSSAGQQYSVLDLFTMLKHADINRLKWILTLDDSFGACLQGTGSNLPGGFSGFLATLQLEYKGKHFGSVDCETLFDPKTFADIVADELTAAKSFAEVVYRNGDRFIRIPEKAGLDTNTEPATVLNADSVVLVLGGAQGITPSVVHRMAEDAPCTYILVGRSEADPDGEAYENCETLDEIKSVLINKEGMTSPKDITTKARRIYKAKQIPRACSLIESTGARAIYKNADVTDPDSLAALIDDVQLQYGRIDGLIHAAGVVEDKLFRDKQADSFARVYDTKAAPMAILAHTLIPQLKLLVMFSSVVAEAGNPGQCDYGAGNSALNNAARLFARLYPDMRVVAFNWGPWKGAGMVSTSLQGEFSKAGMSLIELDSGAEFCADEVAYGNAPVVTAISASESVLAKFVETFDE